MKHDVKREGKKRVHPVHLFRRFTADSDILTALAATMIVPCAAEGMIRTP